MKTHILIMACAMALTLPAMDKSFADGAVYPGDVDKPFKLINDPEYKGHVIEACHAYMEAVDATRNPELAPSLSESECREKLAAAREELMKRVEMYPDEINDTDWGHHAFETSPFFAAVYGNDLDLVVFMVKRGALPFVPEYCYNGLELSFDLRSYLFQMRNRYNVLEIMLKARKAGIEIEGKEPTRPDPPRR